MSETRAIGGLLREPSDLQQAKLRKLGTVSREVHRTICEELFLLDHLFVFQFPFPGGWFERWQAIDHAFAKAVGAVGAPAQKAANEEAFGLVIRLGIEAVEQAAAAGRLGDLLERESLRAAALYDDAIDRAAADAEAAAAEAERQRAERVAEQRRLVKAETEAAKAAAAQAEADRLAAEEEARAAEAAYQADRTRRAARAAELATV